MKAGPMGAAVIEALLRRAEASTGPQQALLLQRAQARMAALAEQTEGVEPAIAGLAPPAVSTALQGLSALIDRLGREPAASAAAATSVASTPALKAVATHKRTWMRLRAEQRLRQATAQVPAAPGPLNASHLVNRLLQTLHTLSPDYLDAFMAQVDALLWLEQASGGALADLQRSGSAGRRSASASSASKQRRHRQPV